MEDGVLLIPFTLGVLGGAGSRDDGDGVRCGVAAGLRPTALGGVGLFVIVDMLC